ncbi:hypothetical protein BDR22DRAFT_31225 [Usnea florida]
MIVVGLCFVVCRCVRCGMGKGRGGEGGWCRVGGPERSLLICCCVLSRPKSCGFFQQQNLMYIQISPSPLLSLSLPLLCLLYRTLLFLEHFSFHSIFLSPYFFIAAPRHPRLQQPGLRRRSSPALTYPRRQLLWRWCWRWWKCRCYFWCWRCLKWLCCCGCLRTMWRLCIS